jgi:uncharacterized protein
MRLETMGAVVDVIDETAPVLRRRGDAVGVPRAGSVPVLAELPPKVADLRPGGVRRVRRVVVAGASGFLGRALCRRLAGAGWDVVGLVREEGARIEGARVAVWDGRTAGQWWGEIDGAEAVINLAGRSVNCRYRRDEREEILRSRLDSTRALGRAVGAAMLPPSAWLNSSTATIYRHAEDRAMDEEWGEMGEGFSVDVARRWEAEFFAGELAGTRRVAMRSAIVFGPGAGGPYEVMRRLVEMGLGGRQGSGRQYVSWISLEDWLRAVEWLLERRELDGVINLAAPQPVRNEEFMRELRASCGMPFGLPAPRPALELGAWLMGTETELVLKSRRVVPRRLLREGFEFRHGRVGEMLRALGPVGGRAVAGVGALG